MPTASSPPRRKTPRPLARPPEAAGQTQAGLDEASEAARVAVVADPWGQVSVQFSGDWRLNSPRPALREIWHEIEILQPQRLVCEAPAAGAWDTGLMVFLYSLWERAEAAGITLDTTRMPTAVQGLLELAQAVPESVDAQRAPAGFNFFTFLGNTVLAWSRELSCLWCFIGTATLACISALRKGISFRPQDFWLLVQQAGVDALPIVALLSFLVGLIFAFVGALQLEALGASIFIADLVGLSMTREMGAVITSIILCGRTGAAYAATIGSMKANEELDALETLGISPSEFLVVPRILALVLMMPLLVLFSIFIGMAGGLIIGVVVLDLSPVTYIQQTLLVVNSTQFIIGISKGLVFGLLVATSGCMRGMQAGGSAEDVGQAATSAVVTGVTAIVIADAAFAILLNILGI